MKTFIIMVILCFSINAFALSDEQNNVKRMAKIVGSQNCIEGMCFEKTLQAIAWQESSFGVNTIGDAKGTFYYYKHHNENIYINKKDTFIENGKRYYWYQPFQEKYRKIVYSKVAWKPLARSSLGPFQIKVPTAIRTIKEMGLKQYYYLISNENRLVNKLLNDLHFGATIAVNYLKLNYLDGMKKGYSNPWKLAVSRYNGGDNNTRYINKISDKIKSL